MNIFKKWLNQSIANKEAIKIHTFIKNNMLTSEGAGIYRRNYTATPHLAMMLTKEMQAFKTPIKNLNDSIGEKIMDVIVSTGFHQSGIDLLAWMLDQGYQVNEKMLFRLERFDIVSYESSMFNDRKILEQKNHDLKNPKNFVKLLDLLTTFGAKWDTPSQRDLQYPTVLDYLYHTTKPHETQVTKCLQDYYKDGTPQKNTPLNSDDIMRRRMEKLFASDQNDIQIETGEKVTISATPKTNRMTQ